MIFLIGKFRKQLKCSIMGNRLNKLRYRHIKYFAKNDEDIDRYRKMTKIYCSVRKMG